LRRFERPLTRQVTQAYPVIEAIAAADLSGSALRAAHARRRVQTGIRRPLFCFPNREALNDAEIPGSRAGATSHHPNGGAGALDATRYCVFSCAPWRAPCRACRTQLHHSARRSRAVPRSTEAQARARVMRPSVRPAPLTLAAHRQATPRRHGGWDGRRVRADGRCALCGVLPERSACGCGSRQSLSVHEPLETSLPFHDNLELHHVSD
jgi:hypothetical protein